MDHPSTDKEHAPAPQSGDVETRLQHIENSLAQLNTKLDRPKDGAAAPATTSQPASKVLLAGMFGLVGMKLGGFVATKVGLLADAGIAYSKKGKEGLKEIGEVFFTLGRADKSVFKTLKYTFMGTIGGMVLGGVGGVVLGWNRGDRLENPGELFKHPIDSLQKIFARHPKKAAPAEASPTPSAQAAAGAPHTLTSVEHQGIMTTPEQELAR